MYDLWPVENVGSLIHKRLLTVNALVVGVPKRAPAGMVAQIYKLVLRIFRVLTRGSLWCTSLRLWELAVVGLPESQRLGPASLERLRRRVLRTAGRTSTAPTSRGELSILCHHHPKLRLEFICAAGLTASYEAGRGHQQKRQNPISAHRNNSGVDWTLWTRSNMA